MVICWIGGTSGYKDTSSRKRIYARGFTRYMRIENHLVHITIHYMHEVVFSKVCTHEDRD